MRHLFDRNLDAVELLLNQAAPLPSMLHHRRLRVDVAVAYHISRALLQQLRRQDPLTRRIILPGPVQLLATLRGVLRGGSLRKKVACGRGLAKPPDRTM